MHLFPEFHNDSKSCDLYAVNNQPLDYRTLQFDNSSDHRFAHSFILTDIVNPILEVDFLHQNHMIIETTSFSISIKKQQPSQQLVTSLSDVNLTALFLHNVLNIYPDLVSGVLCLDK